MQIRLSVKNWRSIESAEVELRSMNVLVGRNATGKSNLCDALIFFRDIATDASSAVSRRGGIASIRRWSPHKPYDVDLGLTVASDDNTALFTHSIRLSSGRDGDWSFKRERIEIRSKREHASAQREGNKLVFERQIGGRPAKVPFAGRDNFEIAPTTSAVLLARQVLFGFDARAWLQRIGGFRTLRPSPELMRVPQQATERKRLESTADNIASALAGLTDEKRERVLTSMQRIIPELESISTVSSGRYQSVQFVQNLSGRRRAEFTATEMSDGALRALALIVAAAQNERDQLLIVEEPEVNLHPGASAVVFDALRDAAKRGVVLVTTHSPEILDHAATDNIFVADYREGVTTIGPLAEKQRRAVREGLLTVAELVRTDELRAEGVAPPTVAP
jgi:type I restriction enzyme M protein